MHIYISDYILWYPSLFGGCWRVLTLPFVRMNRVPPLRWTINNVLFISHKHIPDYKVQNEDVVYQLSLLQVDWHGALWVGESLISCEPVFSTLPPTASDLIQIPKPTDKLRSHLVSISQWTIYVKRQTAFRCHPLMFFHRFRGIK